MYGVPQAKLGSLPLALRISEGLFYFHFVGALICESQSIIFPAPAKAGAGVFLTLLLFFYAFNDYEMELGVVATFAPVTRPTPKMRNRKNDDFQFAHHVND